MSQYTAVLTRAGFDDYTSRTNAMATGVQKVVKPDAPVSAEAMAAAAYLTFHVPEFSWTFEVDVFGGYRITVHFKGAEINVDATE